MLVHGNGFAVGGGAAERVRVELDARGGLPGFALIGLAGAPARDARERVQAAVLNSGFAFPRKRLTANLASGSAPRSGPAFDLVLACCVLAVQDEFDPERLGQIGLFAELGLGGDLRPCPSVSAVTQAAAAAGLSGLGVAQADLREAHAIGALPVAGLPSLAAVAALLRARPGGGGPRAGRAAVA